VPGLSNQGHGSTDADKNPAETQAPEASDIGEETDRDQGAADISVKVAEAALKSESGDAGPEGAGLPTAAGEEAPKVIMPDILDLLRRHTACALVFSSFHGHVQAE